MAFFFQQRRHLLHIFRTFFQTKLYGLIASDRLIKCAYGNVEHPTQRHVQTVPRDLNMNPPPVGLPFPSDSISCEPVAGGL